ncbi:hypothetical protein V8C26DRAFT_405766 [Trichoderma gracile]
MRRIWLVCCILHFVVACSRKCYSSRHVCNAYSKACSNSLSNFPISRTVDFQPMDWNILAQPHRSSRHLHTKFQHQSAWKDSHGLNSQRIGLVFVRWVDSLASQITLGRIKNCTTF